MPSDDASDDRETPLERAAEQALELRATVDELSDRALRDLVDLVLIEIGIRLAARLR